MRKIIALILSLGIILTLTQSVLSQDSTEYSGYIALQTGDILNAYGESDITLPIEFSNDAVEGISILKNDMPVSFECSIEKNVLHVSPMDYFEGGAVHVIKIFTHSGKRYKILVRAVDTFVYDRFDEQLISKEEAELFPDFFQPTGDIVIKISPKPEKGFNYPYFLMIPSNATSNGNKKFLVVEPNNSALPSNSFGVHEEGARIALHAKGSVTSGSGGFNVATSLNTPLLIPVFPRLSDESAPYMQFLDRKSLTSEGETKRVDQQLSAMIKDARDTLKTRGIIVEKKVFMVGFSASAKFVQRYITLHPEEVQAIAVGAVAGTTTLPMKEYNGVKLRYPVGIADLKQFTGKDFDMKSYKQIAQYIYMGDNDTNDATNYRDCYEEEDAQTIWRVLGRNMPDRFNETLKAVNKGGFGSSVQFHTYKGIGHDISDNMYSDIVEFFKVNGGDKFVKIKPHENAY